VPVRQAGDPAKAMHRSSRGNTKIPEQDLRTDPRPRPPAHRIFLLFAASIAVSIAASFAASIAVWQAETIHAIPLLG
jgi:hypothetical protein